VPDNRKEETAAPNKRVSHPRSNAPVTKPVRKLDKSKNPEATSSESSHYAVSGAINNKFQLVYDVIQLDRGTENHRHSASGASAINSNVILAAAPCDKHPPEYFAQLLQDKQNQKAKLNQLWPKHWGCKTDLIYSSFFSLSISLVISILFLFGNDGAFIVQSQNMDNFILNNLC
jgi:hypothetical protein